MSAKSIPIGQKRKPSRPCHALKALVQQPQFTSLLDDAEDTLDLEDLEEATDEALAYYPETITFDSVASVSSLSTHEGLSNFFEISNAPSYSSSSSIQYPVYGSPPIYALLESVSSSSFTSSFNFTANQSSSTRL